MRLRSGATRTSRRSMPARCAVLAADWPGPTSGARLCQFFGSRQRCKWPLRQVGQIAVGCTIWHEIRPDSAPSLRDLGGWQGQAELERARISTSERMAGSQVLEVAPPAD